MDIRTLNQPLWPVLAALVLALFLTFPGGGFAQGTPAAECVANETDGSCLPIAPIADRVDLAEPVFSDPTAITNPLFPISDLTQILQLGIEESEPLRVEATLLPETKTIGWNGQDVETVASQFIAYRGGSIVEVATDFYAQADDGSVWYFGEDVFNYEDGVVADTHGTWLAGKDGPPGMIMPGDPQVGDVYRPENIPGFVFEEVTVKAVDQTVDGPEGPVEGAIVTEELLMDGSLEEKMYAPGYGEFSAEASNEFVILALGVPFDAQTGAMPPALATLATGSETIIRLEPDENWDNMAATVAKMTIAWETYDAGDVPRALATQLDGAFDALTTAVEDRDVAAARQAAVDVGRATLDFQLQHRSLAEVELDRLVLWTDQLLLDAGANDPGAVAGDVAVAEAIWDRAAATVDPSAASEIDTLVTDLRTAADGGDLAATSDVATELRDLLIAVP